MGARRNASRHRDTLDGAFGRPGRRRNPEAAPVSYSVESLLDVFGYFLLVLIGVELLETLRSYMKKDVIHVRVVLEVALIAMARKAIIAEPGNAPVLTSVGLAALILALGVAFYFERRTEDKE